jgi:hypothetical protein
MYSFDNVDSPSGILVDLATWQAFSPAYAERNFAETKNPLYLRIKRTKLPV